MIHTLRLTLPNVFLITGEKAVLIDTGTPRDATHILTFLQTHGIDVRDLALILHTHAHWDHAGSTALLKTMTHAPIAIHRADAECLRRGSNGSLRPTGIAGRVLKPFLDRPYPPVEPDLLLDEEISLSGFGVSARILFTPGHTAGSISILTTDGEIIVGDLLIGGHLGGWIRPHKPGLHYFAENIAQVRASIRKILALSPEVIHSGHGGPFDPREVDRRFASA